MNEYWMTEITEKAGDIPIINLAIPGSHNSMTYGINSFSKIAPDAEPSTRRIYYILPCFVRRWSKNQSVDVEQQLKLGIRYFDLRVCQKKDKLYYCHGLLAMEIFGPLTEINTFLETHPHELVVLDFQHFYDMQPHNHNLIHSFLKQTFGSKLYTRHDGPLSKCTLNNCKKQGKQILIIYRRCNIPLPQDFWPSFSWPTPWPNVCSTNELTEFLDTALLTRQPIYGYVTQCILTPTPRYITIRCLSSLRRTAKKVDKNLENWINSQKPGEFTLKEKPRVNVFISDFVDLNEGEFCNWIINLNSCLECDGPPS